MEDKLTMEELMGLKFFTKSSNIIHHCCYGCGDPLEDIFCHKCTCESCGKGAHYSYNCSSHVLVIPNPEPCNNQTIDELLQTLPSFDPACYSRDGNSFTYDSKSNIVDDSPNVLNPPRLLPKCSYEFCGNDTYYGHDCPPQQLPVIDQTPLEESMKNLRITFQAWSENIQQKNEEEEKQIAKEQAAKARYWKIPICYDDDEDCSIAITSKEPHNYLSMGDEHLDTIQATKSDEFIKSSVENLVPSPNPHHFNAESDLIESLLKHDSMIISSSSKIDSLLDEFAGELTLLKSIPPGINETDCDPKEEIYLIKKLFDSFIEEIDLSFTPNDPIPQGIEEDDYDSERDILILEELLSNNSLSLPENESFHFDIPSSFRPPAKTPDEDDISLIATFIGQHVMLDSYTSSMCIDSWGRSSFARYLIEVNFKVDRVDVVTVGVPSLTGEGFTKETIRVEYEWRPPRCDICKIFGHVHDQCPKKVVNPHIVTTSNVVISTVVETNDGFQMVGKKKKKKGKSKSTNGGKFVGPSVNQSVRYELKATTSAPKKGATNGNAFKSSSMLKTAVISLKKDNFTTSNSFSALNDEEEDEEENVDNVYDESANLFTNKKPVNVLLSRLLLVSLFS
nr:zinc knuckle CX2CX4HX4C [Tanacetum cinerariifolium]